MLHPAPLIDALYALALGLVLGLVYDLLRPPRRAMRKLAFLPDLVFCALAAFGAFSLAMRDEYGRFGLWSVAAGLAGFLLWLELISGLFAPVAARFWSLAARAVRFVVKYAKMPFISAKNLFSDLKSRFILRKKGAQGDPQ